MAAARRREVMGLALAAVLAVAGCGGSGSRGFEIGLKRVAVDLAFTDEAKAAPPVEITVEQVLQAPPAPTLPGFTTDVAPEVVRPRPAAARPPAGPACPAAGPDVRPDIPVRVFATTEPEAGFYTTHNQGTFTVGVGVGAFTGPYPRAGAFTIKGVRHDQSTSAVDGVTTKIVYDVVETGLDGAEVTTTYQTTNSQTSAAGQVQRSGGLGPQPMGALELVRQVRRAGPVVEEFNPSPPVTIMAFRSGEGTSWTSAGIDQRTGTALFVQGQILSREVVDVCGTLHDTYRVRSTERLTNLNRGFSSSTDPQDPNIYNVATQLGGLFIRRYVNTTTTAPGADGSTNTLAQKYTATLDSATPRARG